MAFLTTALIHKSRLVFDVIVWLTREKTAQIMLLLISFRLVMTGFAMNLQAVLRLMSVLMMERLSQMRLRVHEYLLWRL